MKDIYFIRHGQTVKNGEHVHQHYDEPLSVKGNEQAKALGEFVKTLEPDVLITSPFARARQTAAYVGEAIGVPYSIDVSVHETVRPSYLYGKHHLSFATFRYLLNLFLHQNRNGWDDAGAENMFDVRNRVHDTKDMIMETREDTIVIISHAVFIDLFIHWVCAEKSMSLFRFIHMIIFMKKMPNTGIAHIEYDPDAPVGVCQWQLIRFITPDKFNK
jgi:broad specificity phosphatase PhoE